MNPPYNGWTHSIGSVPLENRYRPVLVLRLFSSAHSLDHLVRWPLIGHKEALATWITGARQWNQEITSHSASSLSSWQICRSLVNSLRGQQHSLSCSGSPQIFRDVRIQHVPCLAGKMSSWDTMFPRRFVNRLNLNSTESYICMQVLLRSLCVKERFTIRKLWVWWK